MEGVTKPVRRQVTPGGFRGRQRDTVSVFPAAASPTALRMSVPLVIVAHMFDNGAAATPLCDQSAADLPTERLEAEITTLAGHLAAATCRWLVLIAEFDRREGWRAWDQSSCAAWLSWQCGLSLTTAHEHVRVARSLGALPAITEAFAAGRLSFSKVRALTRVATRDNEDGWLSAALGATAAQLDRLARACVRVGRSECAHRAERERVTWRYDEDGMLVFTARLAPERGAHLIAALGQIQHAATEHHTAGDGTRANEDAARAHPASIADTRTGPSSPDRDDGGPKHADAQAQASLWQSSAEDNQAGQRHGQRHGHDHGQGHGQGHEPAEGHGHRSGSSLPDALVDMRGTITDEHSAPITPRTIQPTTRDPLHLDYAVAVLTQPTPAPLARAAGDGR